MPNSATTIVGVNHLNNFLKDYPSGIIIETDQLWMDPLSNTLKSRINSLPFKGGNLFEIEMQTTYSYSGQAMGERSDMPYAGAQAYVKMALPMKEIIEPAGLTQKALDMATGGDASWGRIVQREVDQVRNLRFKMMKEICDFGNGTGLLARVVSAAEGSDTVVVTCDNTYIDCGWENVRFIKPGMNVEFYDANGALITDNSVQAWKVTAVSFGDRDNGTATTGTFTIETAAGRDDDITTLLNVDGVQVYLANTRSLTESGGTVTQDSADGTWKYEQTNYIGSVDVHTTLPMGLTGICQTTDASYDYNDGSVDFTMDTFQGLARASYSTLRTQFFNGTDITGGSGTAGTPGDWDTSTVTGAWLKTVDRTGGAADIDLLLVSPELSVCWDRLNTGQIQITKEAANSAGWSTYIEGAVYAKPFRAPNGRLIPVVVSGAIPKNVMYGLTTKDLHWMVQGGGFDWLPYGDGGGLWRLFTGHRQRLYEAWFGGYSQLAAERCDTHFVLQDLADNIG